MRSNKTARQNQQTVQIEELDDDSLYIKGPFGEQGKQTDGSLEPETAGGHFDAAKAQVNDAFDNMVAQTEQQRDEALAYLDARKAEFTKRRNQS